MANAVPETIKRNYGSNSAGERGTIQTEGSIWLETRGLNTMACVGDHVRLASHLMQSDPPTYYNGWWKPIQKSHSHMLSSLWPHLILLPLLSPILDVLSTLHLRALRWLFLLPRCSSCLSMPHLLSHLCSNVIFSIKPNLISLSKITLPPDPIKCACLLSLFFTVTTHPLP